MSKAFVITTGEYSNYRICGVFSTKENAELYLSRFKSPEPDVESTRYNEYDIEEYDLDVFDESYDDDDNLGFTCRIKSDGTFKITYGIVYPSQKSEVHWMRGEYRNYGSWKAFYDIIGYGPTSEHARRSAFELYRGVIAGTLVNPEWDGTPEPPPEPKDCQQMIVSDNADAEVK